MYVCMYVCMYTLMSGAPSGSIKVEYFDRLDAIRYKIYGPGRMDK